MHYNIDNMKKKNARIALVQLTSTSSKEENIENMLARARRLRASSDIITSLEEEKEDEAKN